MTGLAGGLSEAERKLQRGEGEEAARAVAETQEGDGEGAGAGDGKEQEGATGAAAARQEGEGGAEADAGKAANGKDKTVPLAALHEEREERRKSQRETAELRGKVQNMEKMFQALVAARGGAQEEEKPKGPALPSIEDAPVEHFDSRLSAIEREKAEEKTRREQEANHRAQMTQLKGVLAKKEAIVAKEFSDYSEALQFVRAAKAREYYRATGDTEGAVDWVNRQELDFAVSNLKRNKNPARQLYNLAKELGYQKAPPAKGSTAPSNENRMAALEGGAAASRSTGAGRGAGDGEMTLEKLSEMDASDPNFQKHWRRMINKDA